MAGPCGRVREQAGAWAGGCAGGLRDSWWGPYTARGSARRSAGEEGKKRVMTAVVTAETLTSAESLRRRLPPQDVRLTAAVAGPVEILRDRAGVPHVFA